MKRYYGGEKVGRGVYVSLSSGEFIPIPKEGGMLPGGQKIRYIKPPVPLAAAAGPFLGLAYIMFLPFLGIAGIIAFLALQISRGLSRVTRRALETSTLVLKPGSSYLTKKPRQPATPQEEETLKALEKKIAEKRGQETKR